MVYRRITGDEGIRVIIKDGEPTIRKLDAHCVLVLIPPRQHVTKSGLFLKEEGQHWERITSDGRVVRCHTQYEAEEMREMLLAGVQEGQWLNVVIEPYLPQPEDIPYHDWIRGIRGRQMASMGVQNSDLPETQDATLAHITDAEWLARGPR